jgi:hypothetical protein
MLFPAWETFYLLLGSAAGALTGLMFVVVVLLANVSFGTEDAIHAYGTPTVVHFSGVLVLSILLAVPWPGLLALVVTLAMFGLAGTIYMVIVVRRALRQKSYTPVFEDWLFYMAVPIAAYLTLLVAAALLFRQRTTLGMFVTAAAGVLLLCIGIRNAWDNVIYIAVGRREAERDGKQK